MTKTSVDRSLSIQKDLMRLKNERDYFDLDANRLEQKCRVKDIFPQANNLIRLDVLDNLYKEAYGQYNQHIKAISTIIDTIKKEKMEYSISIDGKGREEFIKTHIPKQAEEKAEEKEKDLIDKLADAIG